MSGTLDLFAQYALMRLLAEAEGIQAITWMYLAHVDNGTVGRVRTDKPWARPVVKPRSKNKKQTNTTGTGWFDIALKTLGEKGRVRVYRVVAQ